MQACCLLVFALCLSPPSVCAAADTNTTTNTTNTTTMTTTVTTQTTTTSNSTTTTNTTTTTSTTSTTLTNYTFGYNESNSSTTSTTTSTTTTSTTTTNSTSTTNTTTTSLSMTRAVVPPKYDPNASITTTTPENFTYNFSEPPLIVHLNLSDPEPTYNTTTTMPKKKRTTSTTATTQTVTTTFNGTTTTEKITYTTVTTTTTTTMGKQCEKPSDPAGNYTQDPWSFGDNTSWHLKCNDTHFASNGLTLAKCLGNGVMRPAGVCLLSGCNGNEVNSYSGSANLGNNCPAVMGEGDTCTILCDEDLNEEVTGFFTCIRAEIHGRPLCLSRESKYWVVSWILPKIIGGFDFYADYWRLLNMSNSTIATFETDVSKCLADILLNVQFSHFDPFQVLHMWESQDEYDPETGLLVSHYRSHLFAVTYELLIWDVNVLAANKDRLTDLLLPGSATLATYSECMHTRANITLTELWPSNYPITFNETVLAPDSEISRAATRWIDARLLLPLLAVPNFAAHLLNSYSREGLG